MHLVSLFLHFSMLCALADIADSVDTRAGNDAGEVKLTEQLSRHREKRASIVSLMRGTRAQNFLLSGAWRNIQLSDDFRTVYEKMGNYRQALADFLAVDPTNIRFLNNSKGKVTLGVVGDRRLILRESDLQGSPVLDIFRNTNSEVQHIDTIRYKNH